MRLIQDLERPSEALPTLAALYDSSIVGGPQFVACQVEILDRLWFDSH